MRFMLLSCLLFIAQTSFSKTVTCKKEFRFQGEKSVKKLYTMQTHGLAEQESTIRSNPNERFAGFAIYSEALIRIVRIVDYKTGVSSKYEVPLNLVSVVNSNYGATELEDL